MFGKEKKKQPCKRWKQWRMYCQDSVCVCLCVCVPSSCIMTCSETTRSRSHLPLRAHNRHAGVIMCPAEESVLQREERVAEGRAQTPDTPKWPHSLSPAKAPLICFLGAVMVLIKGAKERETTKKRVVLTVLLELNRRRGASVV